MCCTPLGVMVLTAIANRFRLHKLDRVDEFVMSYGGLRGAVAFALVLLVDPMKVKKQPLFVTATIAVVFFTVFVQGITIKPLVEFLKVKKANKFEKSMHERVQEKVVILFYFNLFMKQNVLFYFNFQIDCRLCNVWRRRRCWSIE